MYTDDRIVENVKIELGDARAELARALHRLAIFVERGRRPAADELERAARLERTVTLLEALVGEPRQGVSP